MCRRMPSKTAPITMTFWSRGNGSVPRLLRFLAAIPLSPELSTNRCPFLIDYISLRDLHETNDSSELSNIKM